MGLQAGPRLSATVCGIRNPGIRAAMRFGWLRERLWLLRLSSSGRSALTRLLGWCGDAARRAFALGTDLLPCRGGAGTFAVARRRSQVHPDYRADRFARGIHIFAFDGPVRSYRDDRISSRRILEVD